MADSPVVVPAGPEYDFFIAHAGPDTDVATRLFDLLATQTRVFLDSKSLKLGDDWDSTLANAQRQSRVTVVLVSGRTDLAFYQREEIATAIELAREDGIHRVVPVYLDNERPKIVPYGLKIKHGLVLGDQSPMEQVVARLLDLLRTLPATPVQADPRSDLNGPHSETEDLASLLNHDPVVSLAAARRLVESGEDIVAPVVAQLAGLNVVSILAAANVLARFPEASGPLMIDRILQADRAWHVANFVPDCFSPAHRPHCADVLASHLHSGNPDVVRKVIESLGFMVAEDLGDEIVRLIISSGDYLFKKYEYYALVARTRMLVLLEGDSVLERWRLPYAFADVEKLIRLSAERGWDGILYKGLADVLAGCQPRHADRLIDVWLVSDLADFRDHAARALGQMRLHRSLPYLEARARDRKESTKVAGSAAFAIANIGGGEAVAVLESLVAEDRGQTPTFRWALARSIADAADDGQFERLSRDLISNPPGEVCWVYRAIGLRRDERFVPELRAGLRSNDDTVRGDSSLALARVEGAKARVEVARSYVEAATTQERILATLALLVCGEPPPGDADLARLRIDLATESFMYNRLTTDDIVAVMLETGGAVGSMIASAWQAIYAKGPGY